MEVDMHAPASPPRSSSFGASARATPSFAATIATSTSSKRARSPAPGSPTHDRPSKRPSLAFGASRIAGGGIAVPQPTPAPQPFPRLPAGSEDWVARASGLRIASPLAVVGPGIPQVTERKDALRTEEEDTLMADADVSMSPPSSQGHPNLHDEEPPEPYIASLLSTGQSTDAQSRFLRPPGNTGENQPRAYRDQLRIPAIQVQGATPSPVHLHPGVTRAFSDGNVVTLAQGQGHPVRKQRVTMGPRADCDKCRRGVPGHWMHYD